MSLKNGKTFDTPVCLWCHMQIAPKDGFHAVATTSYKDGVATDGAMMVPCPDTQNTA